jgi:hypothetical protein
MQSVFMQSCAMFRILKRVCYNWEKIAEHSEACRRAQVLGGECNCMLAGSQFKLRCRPSAEFFAKFKGTQSEYNLGWQDENVVCPRSIVTVVSEYLYQSVCSVYLYQNNCIRTKYTSHRLFWGDSCKDEGLETLCCAIHRNHVKLCKQQEVNVGYDRVT